MKIEAIDIYHVRMPLIEPWRTAYGSDDAVESVLVRLRSDGIVGWGESCPLAMPCYSPEYAEGVFTLIKNCLAPRLLGKTIPSGAALQSALKIFKGNYFAKAALDNAWWDLYATSLNKPLYAVLGGKRRTVSTGADFGVRDSVDALVELVGEAVHTGAPRVKLKFAPGWDMPVLEKIRTHYPKAVFHIDCNSAYTLQDMPLFKDLDRFRLAMIEQPLTFDDLGDHAILQREIETPICLDESINSLHRTQQAIAMKACRWINIKPGRVGGLTVAKEIHDLCACNHIPCWVGGMLESALGVMQCAALATLPNFKYASDLFPSSRFYVKDLSSPSVTLSSPWEITLPESPGSGAYPEPDRLKKFCLSSASL